MKFSIRFNEDIRLILFSVQIQMLLFSTCHLYL